MNESENISRSEEVKHILNRMPEKGGRTVLLILTILVLLLLVFGFTIQYPERVTGRIVLSSYDAPVRLVTNTTGYIKFIKNPADSVSANQILGYIDNPARIEDVLEVEKWINNSLGTPTALCMEFLKQQSSRSLGGLTRAFNSLASSLEEYTTNHQINIINTRIANAESAHLHQIELIEQTKSQIRLRDSIDKLIKTGIRRDSIILAKAGISQREFDLSLLKYFESMEIRQSLGKTLVSLEQLARESENLKELLLEEKSQTARRVNLELQNNYRVLQSEISEWKHVYLIQAPVSGRAEYLNFWRNNDFITAGTSVVSIIPSDNTIVGQVFLPPYGAGKVFKGQNVIIRLDDFPSREFGTVKGYITSVSGLSTTIEEPATGRRAPVYLVTITLPEGLKTNYGVTLDAKAELSGVADILVKKRRIIHRLFDNLKYIVSDN